MSDVTQGQDAPDDASLFSDATTTTLEKFENPELPLKPVEKKPDAPQEVKPEAKPEQPDAPVPAGRLREESEARRRAERERDDLLRQLAASRVPPPQQQQPQQKPDMFENPSNFVQSEVRPYFEQIAQQMRLQAEVFSEQMAGSAYGREKVNAAKQALTEGMHRGDPEVHNVWKAAMESQHPYDLITRWHLNNETMREVGGDLTAYKKRILEEARHDPEYQRTVIEASKGGAQHVARPVISSVPKIPSLGNVGAGGGEADLQEPSDEQLFRAATTAKRR
jgi:hypothetical protein